MGFVFDPDPKIDAALKGRFIQPRFNDFDTSLHQRYLEQAGQKQSTAQEFALQAKQGAMLHDRGVAAAVALTDAAHAEEEQARQMQKPAVAGNQQPARAAPPVKANAVAPSGRMENGLGAQQANSMYEAIQQMDPLGQAFMAAALHVPAETFRSKEQMQIEQMNAQSVLNWRKAMDDPNSQQRKALESGDLAGFAKQAAAAGAIDPLQAVNLLDGLRSEDAKRNAYGFDTEVYDKAMVPILAKSQTLSNPQFAEAMGDEPAVGKDGRVVVFNVPTLLKTPGSVEDVVRSTATAAAEDLLGQRDMRPYVMASNNTFFDQIGTYLSNELAFDPATGVAKLPQFNSSFMGVGGDEPVNALRQNLKAYINHQRVALIASRRYSPEAVRGMDDMQVLSIATGKPRMAAIVDDDGEPILGDAKTILQQQGMFAPNAYNSLLQQAMPETTATGEQGKAAGGGEKKAAKKPSEDRGAFLHIPGATMMSSKDKVGG